MPFSGPYSLFGGVANWGEQRVPEVQDWWKNLPAQSTTQYTPEQVAQWRQSTYGDPRTDLPKAPEAPEPNMWDKLRYLFVPSTGDYVEQSNRRERAPGSWQTHRNPWAREDTSWPGQMLDQLAKPIDWLGW